MLSNLGLDELDCFLYLVQDGTFKCHILNDVHFCTHLFIDAFIADKTGTGTREEFLRILAKEKYTGSADILFAFLVGDHKTIVLSQVLQGNLSIPNQFGIFNNSIHINVINGRTIYSRVLEVAFPFVIH